MPMGEVRLGVQWVRLVGPLQQRPLYTMLETLIVFFLLLMASPTVIPNFLDLLRNMIKENPGVDHLLVCMARDSGSRQDWVSKAF